jgi:hypothetical protein
MKFEYFSGFLYKKYTERKNENERKTEKRKKWEIKRKRKGRRKLPEGSATNQGHKNIGT